MRIFLQTLMCSLLQSTMIYCYSKQTHEQEKKSSQNSAMMKSVIKWAVLLPLAVTPQINLHNIKRI